MEFNAQTVLNLVVVFLVVLVAGFLYNKWADKNEEFSEADNYKLIQEFLLNESPLSDSKKPILWIHVPHEMNARKWKNFGSRNTRELNQPYLRMCIKSIIQKCSQSFNICLIDDNTFTKLIPGWTINVDIMPDPVKSHTRQLAMLKLLYKYGGMIVPAHFVCFTDLIRLYKNNTRPNMFATSCPFVVPSINRAINEDNMTGRAEVFPDIRFMGCLKGDPMMAKCIRELEIVNARDYTSEQDVVNQMGIWCARQINAGIMIQVRPNLVGLYDARGRLIPLEDLMSSSKVIEFDPEVFGILIPYENLVRRRHYEWLLYLDEEKVRENPCNLCVAISSSLDPTQDAEFAASVMSRQATAADMADEVDAANATKKIDQQLDITRPADDRASLGWDF